VYSVPEFAAKLRCLADALESGEPFPIQVAGKRVSVPRRAQIGGEHERCNDEGEVELQLRWDVAGLPGSVEDNEPLVSHWEPRAAPSSLPPELRCASYESGGRRGRSMSEGVARSTWTFLTNHGHVFVCIAEDPGIRGRDIAVRVGITERAAQSIVADLVAEGYITRTRVGRRNRYEIHSDAPLRHPIEGGHSVGEVLVGLALPPRTRTSHHTA